MAHADEQALNPARLAAIEERLFEIERRFDEVVGHLATLPQQLADEILQRQPPSSGSDLVDAATLAGELGVKRSYVYEHADELGVERLPSKGKRKRQRDRDEQHPKPRLRFNVDRAREAMGCLSSKQSRGASPDTEPNPVTQCRSRRRSPKPAPVERAILGSRARKLL